MEIINAPKNESFLKLTIKAVFELKKVVPHLSWILKYILFYLKSGKILDMLNYCYAVFFTKEEGIVALGEPFYRKRSDLVSYPRRIELEATTRCSLRCIKCEQRYWKEKQKNMSLTEFSIIMEQFPELRAISLSGIGHNFENPEYMEMLRYCKKRRLYTQFFDTFLLVNKSRAKELVKIGIDRIMISIDAANSETYKEIQVGSNLNIVTKNLESIVCFKNQAKSLIPELCFVFVVMKNNLSEMPEFLHFVKRILGNSQPIIWIQFIQIRAFDATEQLKFEEKEYFEKVKETKTVALKLGGFRLSFINPPLQRAPVQYCTAWTVPFITVDGDVYPCCTFTEGNIRDIMRINAMGNVMKEDFKVIWNGNKYKDFRKNFGNNIVSDICKNFSSCPFYNLKSQ